MSEERAICRRAAISCADARQSNAQIRAATSSLAPLRRSYHARAMHLRRAEQPSSAHKDELLRRPPTLPKARREVTIGQAPI